MWKLCQLEVANTASSGILNHGTNYIAATEAIEEAMWLQGLFQELKFFDQVATVYSKSQSAIHLCKNPVFHNWTKIFDVKYHLIKEKVTQGVNEVGKVPMEENLIDMGTNVVTLNKFIHCFEFAGNRSRVIANGIEQGSTEK